jgi:hypothetical protein
MPNVHVAFTGLIAVVPPRGNPGQTSAYALFPETRRPLAEWLLPGTNANAVHHPLLACTQERTNKRGSAYHHARLSMPLADCLVRLASREADLWSDPPAGFARWNDAAFAGFRLSALVAERLDRRLLTHASDRLSALVEIRLASYELSASGVDATVAFTDEARPQAVSSFVTMDVGEQVAIEIYSLRDGRQVLAPTTWKAGAEGDLTLSISHTPLPGAEVPDEQPDHQFLRYYELLVSRPARCPLPTNPAQGDNPRCVPTLIEP